MRLHVIDGWGAILSIEPRKGRGRAMFDHLEEILRALGGWAYASAGALVALLIAWWKRQDGIDARLERMQERWREELRVELKAEKRHRGVLELALRILSNEVERISPGNSVVVKVQTIMAFEAHEQIPVDYDGF